MPSEQFWTALFTALPPTVVAFGAFLQGRKNGKKADVAVNYAEAAASRTAEVKEQTETIKVQTDGKLARILAELEAERAARLQAEEDRRQLEEELTAAYAILSVRAKKPVMKIRDIGRASDFGEPHGNGGAHPYRRETDPKESE